MNYIYLVCKYIWSVVYEVCPLWCSTYNLHCKLSTYYQQLISVLKQLRSILIYIYDNMIMYIYY